MKTTCEWGDGPDVIMSLSGSKMILHESPNDKDAWTHGTVSEGSLDLTADVAERLGVELIAAASQVRRLNEEYAEHCKEHHRKQIELMRPPKDSACTRCAKNKTCNDTCKLAGWCLVFTPAKIKMESDIDNEYGGAPMTKKMEWKNIK